MENSLLRVLIRHLRVASYTRTKLHKVEKKSATGEPTFRHSLFVETALVEDSLFPFKAGENMIARIDNDMLIITNDKGVIVLQIRDRKNRKAS
jgi:hypothetical protein